MSGDDGSFMLFEERAGVGEEESEESFLEPSDVLEDEDENKDVIGKSQNG